MNKLSPSAVKANKQYHESLASKLSKQLAEQYKNISDCYDAKQLINQNVKG